MSVPKFVENGSDDPTYSIADYWEKFTISMTLHQKNIDIDAILAKETVDLSDEEKSHLKIARVAFLNSLGDSAVKVIKAKNPKVETAEKDLKWIKDQWEEIWKIEDSKSQKFVKLFQAKREKSETVQKFWSRITELIASCKVEDISSAEVENSLALAMFTVGVDDPEWVKCYGRRNGISQTCQKI